jgi:uncharacterized protein (TIGR01777 family)
MSKILITGASGLVGTRLTQLLLESGHEVSHLGRSKKAGSIKSFVWDVEKGTLDSEALKNIDIVIHLAGTGIADKRWSEKRKREILESRTKSTALLARHLENNTTVKTVVSASAIGYYGFDLTEKEFTENSPAGKGFLADVVKAWEAEADKIKDKRLVKIRTGIVLSEKDGALNEMAKPVRWGMGAPLGTGDQYVSWIHLDDLCRIFIKAVEDESLHGAYNATAGAVTNRALTQAIAKTLHKPLWLPAVPAFALTLALGEMAQLVLYGSVVSSKKIEQAGFTFAFSRLDDALNNLLNP